MDSIAILGGGRIGRFLASKLSERYPVKLLDIEQVNTDQKEITSVVCDATQRNELKKALNPSDLVISAVPGRIGFTVLKNVIDVGCSIVDISFFEEDPFQLQELARQREVTAIIDAGVAPGLSNFIGGYYDQNHDLLNFHCYVGGLPVKRTLPWEYKAPFSPGDVIEEYTRPARVKEAGQIIQKPALTDYHHIETDPLGTLEAFNTDGLRTLLTTLKVPDMKEQTLRYPGHREKLKLLSDTGLFKEDPITLEDGQSISPKRLMSELLKRQWHMSKDDKDCTFMRIDLELSSQIRRIELFDRYDDTQGETSMARCTGYSCLQFVHWMMGESITQKGIVAPEHVGTSPEFYEEMLEYLRGKGITITDQQLD